MPTALDRPVPRPARAARAALLGAAMSAATAAHAQSTPPIEPAAPAADTAPVIVIQPAAPATSATVPATSAPAATSATVTVYTAPPAPQPPPPPARVYAPAPAPAYARAPMYYYYPPGGAAAAAPGPRRERLRGTLGFTFGATAVVADSPFNRAAALWGFDGFHLAGQLGIDGGGFVTPWLMIGGRAGYGWTGAGHAASDNASLMLHMLDAGALVRVGYPAPVGRAWWLFVGAQGTAGAMHAWTTLRGESRSAWLPRGSAELVLHATGERLGVSVRAGYTFANWGALGTAGESQPLGGVSLTVGMEVRL